MLAEEEFTEIAGKVKSEGWTQAEVAVKLFHDESLSHLKERVT